MAGWHPPQGEFELGRSRWLTWAEFISDEEFQRGEPNFAEQVYKTYGTKGPPIGTTHDEMKAAFAANEDATMVGILADVTID